MAEFNKIGDINAQIAVKTAEMEALRSELEVLQKKKSEIQRVQNEKLNKQMQIMRKAKYHLEFNAEKAGLNMPENMEQVIKPVIYDSINDVYGDLDDMRQHMEKITYANFGDIVDLMGNRHYGFSFVGKNGQVTTTNRSHYMVLDQEYGVTVPYDICKYLTDSVGSYEKLKLDGCICVFELPFYDVTVQKYNVEPGQLYEYRQDENYDNNWDLYIIYEDGSERQAKLK